MTYVVALHMTVKCLCTLLHNVLKTEVFLTYVKKKVVVSMPRCAGNSSA
jgi:hypothetical protein